ncbi:MAG TPA: DinB family protein [Longimicrobiaceae bacterium]|nr:DinB family protein [Longimicrobiaceae bacterium]
MATATTQDAFIHDRLREVERVSEQARQLTSGLSAAQLRWTPPSGGWSIAQVFEHLVTAHTQYLEKMRPLIREARERGDRAARGEWRPSLAGGFLLRSVDPKNERGGPSPRSWRPAAEPRTDAIEAFLRTQEELLDLLHRAEGLDLNRIRTSSPVSWLIRLNLGDCFAILAAHGQRHMRQVERIRANAAFPK